MEKKSKPTTVGVTMFEGAPPRLFRYAKANRHKPTPAESKLWDELKGSQLGGYKFRRQHPVGNYILDFYCHRKKLAIELDGGYHLRTEQQIGDMHKTTVLTELGITVIRFPNDQVLENTAKVCLEIFAVLEKL